MGDSGGDGARATTPVRIAAGLLSTLSRDDVRTIALPAPTPGPRVEALVLLDASGTPRAYLNRCRHLPIPLDGASRRFLSRDGEHLECLTHGARYRREDGLCIAGPCPGKALHALVLERDGDALYVLFAG